MKIDEGITFSDKTKGELRRDALHHIEELYELKNQVDISDLVNPLAEPVRRPKYELICSGSTERLNDRVNEKINQGFDVLGPHTHQKAFDTDVTLRPQHWEHMFCISMLKK
jgi:hypothetical protein